MWVLRQGHDRPAARGSLLNVEVDTLLAPRAGSRWGADEPSEPDLPGGSLCTSSREQAGVGTQIVLTATQKRTNRRNGEQAISRG
jgi:hypothetical protein